MSPDILQLNPEIFWLIMSWYYFGLNKFRLDRTNYGENIKNVASINKSESLSERINNVALVQFHERVYGNIYY